MRPQITTFVRPLVEADLSEADRIFRLAFGTFVGAPDPLSWRGDAELVRTRWRADPQSALGAYNEAGELLGSSFATHWGSFGAYGPLTVRPDLWGSGVAQELLRASLELFERWGTRQIALFTFPHSVKHVGLYQKYGFWPQHLTIVMTKSIEPAKAVIEVPEVDVLRCAKLTGELFPGLELTREMKAVREQGIGETLAAYEHGELVGFAICHIGKGSEAGTGAVYVKFAAAVNSESFERLVAACEELAATRGATQLIAGVNSARRLAYSAMIARGYRGAMQGVLMQRPDAPGYNRPDVYVIDDCR